MEGGEGVEVVVEAVGEVEAVEVEAVDRQCEARLGLER